MMKLVARDRSISTALLLLLVLAGVAAPLGSAPSSSPQLHRRGTSSGIHITMEAARPRSPTIITMHRSSWGRESMVVAGCRCVGVGLQRLRGGEKEHRRIRLRTSSSSPSTTAARVGVVEARSDGQGAAPTSGGNHAGDECQVAGGWEEPLGFGDPAPIPLVDKRNFRPAGSMSCGGGGEEEEGGGGGGGGEDLLVDGGRRDENQEEEEEEEEEVRKKALMKDTLAKIEGGLQFINPLTEMDEYIAGIEDSEGEKAEREAAEREVQEDAEKKAKEGLFEGRDPSTISKEEVESAYEDAKAFAEQTMWVGVYSPIDTIRTALDLVGLAPSDTLLDLGCGDGRVCLLASREYGAAAEGVDADQVSLKYASKMLELDPAAPAVKYTLGDAVEHPFGNATVLYVYLPPELIEEGSDLYDRIAGFLRGGGRVVSIGMPLDLFAPSCVDTRADIKVYVYDQECCEAVAILLDPEEEEMKQKFLTKARDQMGIRDPEIEGEMPQMDGDDRKEVGGFINHVRGEAGTIQEAKMRKSWLGGL